MGSQSFARLTRDITHTSVLGNAQTTDSARGETYLANGGAELAEMIQKIVEFEF
jgi:creatinine amidohydrolase/Fe(II)-dependent formamide hydrolase-like protein